MQIETGDSIPMWCAACGKPWRIDTVSARSYTCPCGSTEATTKVVISSDGSVEAKEPIPTPYLRAAAGFHNLPPLRPEQQSVSLGGVRPNR